MLWLLGYLWDAVWWLGWYALMAGGWLAWWTAHCRAQRLERERNMALKIRW